MTDDCRCDKAHPVMKRWKHHTPRACGLDDDHFHAALLRAEAIRDG